MPLFWKVVLVNAAVFCAGTAALVLSPASVSSDPLGSEVVVVVLGIAVLLLTNALLLRGPLGQVDRVVREMSQLDDPGHGRRLFDAGGTGPGAVLVRSWNDMLDRLEHERRTSNARALAAQEAERNRVAQELHDQVGQSLTVVLLGLKQLEARVPADVAAEHALVRESARAGLDDVRAVARRLRPGVLDDLGLRSAIAALATDFSAHGSAHLRPQVSPGLPDLPPEAELVVYRVAQEALTNVARHAQATQVELSLSKVGDRVVLEVRDDGRGLGGRVAGTGITGMRERALLVGADLDVADVAARSGSGGHGGRGTVVRLSVPVPPSGSRSGSGSVR